MGFCSLVSRCHSTEYLVSRIARRVKSDGGEVTGVRVCSGASDVRQSAKATARGMDFFGFGAGGPGLGLIARHLCRYLLRMQARLDGFWMAAS